MEILETPGVGPDPLPWRRDADPLCVQPKAMTPPCVKSCPQHQIINLITLTGGVVQRKHRIQQQVFVRISFHRTAGKLEDTTPREGCTTLHITHVSDRKDRKVADGARKFRGGQLGGKGHFAAWKAPCRPNAQPHLLLEVYCGESSCQINPLEIQEPYIASFCEPSPQWASSTGNESWWRSMRNLTLKKLMNGNSRFPKASKLSSQTETPKWKWKAPNAQGFLVFDTEKPTLELLGLLVKLWDQGAA